MERSRKQNARCCCIVCPFRPPRCYLGILLTVRVISTVFTFVLFIFSILSRCVYYQFWKTYDVFFLLLHTAIAICLVPLRKDDVFWRLHHLRQNYHERGLSIRRRRANRPPGVPPDGRQIVLETYDTNIAGPDNPTGTGTKDVRFDDNPPEVMDETGELNPPGPGGRVPEKADYGGDDDDSDSVFDRVKGRIRGIPERIRRRLDSEDSEDEDSPEWQIKLASGLHMGIYLIRLRITLALLLGLLHRVTSSESTFTSWKFVMLIKGLYIHIPLLWFQFLFAIVRQLRLWCHLGCARFYLWFVVLLTAGLVLIEIPYHALREYSDESWCYIYADNANSPWCKVFACIGPNGTYTADVTFNKLAIAGVVDS